SATCVAAARASSFALPVTNVSKVNAGFRRDTSRPLALATAAVATSGTGGTGRSTGSLSARRSFNSMGRLKCCWASSSTRRANLSLIHCWTKRFGAVSVTQSPSTVHSRGLIQVRNCWGGSSFSNETRQRRQKEFIGTVLELESDPTARARGSFEFYLFHGWL